MIVPSSKLKKLIELYEGGRPILAKKVGIEEPVLSDLINGKRAASARYIERFCRFTGWPMGEAWDIVDGELED